MRPRADAQRVLDFARELGRLTDLPATMYLTGGATAVLEGWRATTVDIDVRFEPDADELLRLLPALKERLQVNIEFASPPDFIPELPGTRFGTRSRHRTCCLGLRLLDVSGTVTAAGRPTALHRPLRPC